MVTICITHTHIWFKWEPGKVRRVCALDPWSGVCVYGVLQLWLDLILYIFLKITWNTPERCVPCLFMLFANQGVYIRICDVETTYGKFDSWRRMRRPENRSRFWDINFIYRCSYEGILNNVIFWLHINWLCMLGVYLFTLLRLNSLKIIIYSYY